MAMRGNGFIRVELDLPVAVVELLVSIGSAAAAALDPNEADDRAASVATLAAAAIVAIAKEVRQSLPAAEAGGLAPQDKAQHETPGGFSTQHDRLIADVVTVLAGIPGGQRPKVILERLEAADADWLPDQPRAQRLARLGSALWLEARRPNGRLHSTRRGYYRLTTKGC
jgi:hypothetical protein